MLTKMPMRFLGALIGLFMISSGAALAGEADICYSAPRPALSGLNNLRRDDPLHCSIAGTESLGQLAEAGWSIISVMSVAVGPIDNPTLTKGAWMVVIQKSDNVSPRKNKAPASAHES